MKTRGDGNYLKFLTRTARFDLLLVNDRVTDPLTGAERRDFLEMMEGRHGFKSTVITSQYLVAKWHERIGEPTTADTILKQDTPYVHR